MGARDEQAPGGILGALRRLRCRVSRRRTPEEIPELLHRPPDLIPGVAGRGEALAAGVYDFGGQVVRAGDVGEQDETPWRHRGAGEYWLAELQGFAWLRDLRAAGTADAAERGRAMVLDWLQRHRTIENAVVAAWGPEALGRRLSAWLAHGAFLLEGADDAFARRFHKGLELQASHLTRTARNAGEGLPQLIAARGLIESGLCLADGERRIAQGLKLVEAALAKQDAGNRLGRSPSAHLAALWCLAGLRATLEEGGHPAPPAVSEGIGRIASALQLLRHGDGGLALFNGGVEEERGLVDLALGRAAVSGSGAPQETPDIGFSRIESRHTTLIVDTGAPATTGRWAHAGTLSLELSAGRERLIVNCGGWRGSDDRWLDALRATAAHSTLVVDDTNSATLGSDGTIADGPNAVKVERRERDGATWIDASHDGYLDSLGLVHKRRLYVGAMGSDVRGEESLTHVRQRRRRGREFAVRFHLHPDVRCAMTEDRRAALLRLPSGAMWQMRAAGASMSIDESVYAGDGARRRRTSQIALTGPIEDAITVKWAFKFLPKGG